MKKFVSALALMLVISAASAMACIGPNCGPQGTTGSAWAVNGQTQVQGDVGFATPNAFVLGAGSAQEQFGTGGAIGSGSSAFDNQEQRQGSSDSIGTPLNGAGYSEYQEQEGGGHVRGTGLYVYGGSQYQAGIVGAINDGNGTAGAGGSGYVGAGDNFAKVVGNAGAHQNQAQLFESGYSQLNEGPNGFTYVGGHQEAGTTNSVNVNRGEASSEVVVAQAGGSVALNNGQGTQMVGGSGSVGAGSAAVSNRCDAGASFSATQIHEYQQANVSNDGKSWQEASGQTSTTVAGSVGNVNN